eukprot:jgi/Botrbrau1/19561/Bobra.0035s0053.1
MSQRLLSSGRLSFVPISSPGNRSQRWRVAGPPVCSSSKRRVSTAERTEQVYEEPTVVEVTPGPDMGTPIYIHNLTRRRALVLDNSYRPVDVINWQRAICLDLFDKADVLEYYDDCVHSARDAYPIPAVLRVRMFLGARSRGGGMQPSLTRRNILIRDHGECQYCRSKHDLTIDHVVPASLGGQWSWDNLVTACSKCNVMKGARTLKQMGWKLRKQPRAPTIHELGSLLCSETLPDKPPKEWGDYLVGFKKLPFSQRDTTWERDADISMI